MTIVTAETFSTYSNLAEADYFAAPALSQSGIKLLLPPSCPAKFRWAQDHPVFKDAFDYGSAAHKLVLRPGPELTIIEAEDWRTKAAKDARAAARAQGWTPILRPDYEQVRMMADAIRRHPIAGKLFDIDRGQPEVSLFWTHDEYGIPCKARLDWLPDASGGGRLVLPDYKTTTDAGLESIRKAVGNFGYHIQHAWYTQGVAAAGLDDDPAFVFVFQEKAPPYLVNVVQLDAGAIQAGRVACLAAAERYRDCVAADAWPAFPLDIPEVGLPPWHSRIPEDYYS